MTIAATDRACSSANKYAGAQRPLFGYLSGRARLRVLTDGQGSGQCSWAGSWLRRVRGRTSIVLVGLELPCRAGGMRRLDVIRDQRTAKWSDVLVAARPGATVSEIAAKLFLSEGTVRDYLSTAIPKTGARNRVQAVRTADERGWL